MEIGLVAILEDYDRGDDLLEVGRDFRLFHALEIDTWRGSFGWDDDEPSWDRTSAATKMLRIADVKGVLEYDVDGRPREWHDGDTPLSNLRLQRGVPRIFLIW